MTDLATLASPEQLRGELARIGYIGPEEPCAHPIGSYFETHIEQGPVLEAAGEKLGVVDRIITELCVLDVTADGFTCIELAPGVTQDEIRTKTGAHVEFA